MLTAHPYSAAQILQRIQEIGFDGGYSIVKDYVRTIRPKHSPAYLTLSFAPGECAQVDWGSFGSVPVGTTTRRCAAKNHGGQPQVRRAFPHHRPSASL